MGGVVLPAKITLANKRLYIFQIVVQLTVVTCMGYYLWTANMLLREDLPTSSPNAWGSRGVSEEAVAADHKAKICNGDKKFNFKYWYEWEHGDYQCIHDSPEEAYYKRGKTEVYFPTYYRDKIIETASAHGGNECTALKTKCNAAAACAEYDADKDKKGEAGNNYWKKFFNRCYSEKKEKNQPVFNASTGLVTKKDLETCRCEKEGHYIVAGISSRNLDFEHAFEIVKDNGDVISGNVGTKLDSQKVKDGKEIPIVTIVYKEDAVTHKFVEADCGKKGPDGKGTCRFTGGAISLPIGTWAELAHFDIKNADALNSGIGGNLYGKEEPTWNVNDNAPLRLTGMEIQMQIEYTNAEVHKNADGDYGSYMIAKVQVRPVKGVWTGWPQVAYGGPQDMDFNALDAGGAHMYKSGSYRSRDNSGVRFIFKTSTASKFAYFSINELIVKFAVLKVYLGLAGTLVTLFVMNALGNLSKNYQRVSNTNLDLPAEVERRLPTKILVACGAYHALKQMSGSDKVDMNALKICFTKLFESGDFKLPATTIDALAGAVMDQLQPEGAQTGEVDIEKFILAFIASEKMDLQGLTKELDPEKKPNCVENFFDGPDMFGGAIARANCSVEPGNQA